MEVRKIRAEMRNGRSFYDMPLRVTFYARVSTDQDEQINSLENELGVKLFYRTKRSVALTQEGMIFYEDAKSILLKEQAALSKLRFRSTREDPVLGFGFTSSVELEGFLPALAKLVGEKSFRPYLRIISSKSMWNVFLNSDLDCIFAYRDTYPEVLQINVTPIQEVHMACFLPGGNHLAQASRISASDLREEQFLICSPAMLPAAAAALENELLPQFPPDKVTYCESIEATVALVRIGLGVAVLPDNLCVGEGNLVKIPFDTDERLTYCMYTKKEITSNKQEIIRALKDII